ncbi:unnamed protein product [Caenorhabditis angaria]|uniref:C-type lectin domain-containing protein n=1 Tax=Caenorhabditis angaria TaxID=860376 RepID=A0A9P1IQQ8_9PELO|nr:unnamed protein product [Caenorhabditis angaria]
MSKISYGIVWIGLQRTEDCWYKNTTNCNTGNGFEWTDGSTNMDTKLLEKNWWTPGNPDNSGLMQPYVVMFMSSNKSDGLSGKLDDVPEDYVGTKDFILHGFVCGKPANLKV